MSIEMSVEYVNRRFGNQLVGIFHHIVPTKKAIQKQFVHRAQKQCTLPSEISVDQTKTGAAQSIDVVLHRHVEQIQHALQIVKVVVGFDQHRCVVLQRRNTESIGQPQDLNCMLRVCIQFIYTTIGD
jgi:hypothetical protein